MDATCSGSQKPVPGNVSAYSELTAMCHLPKRIQTYPGGTAGPVPVLSATSIASCRGEEKQGKAAERGPSKRDLEGQTCLPSPRLIPVAQHSAGEDPVLVTLL